MTTNVASDDDDDDEEVFVVAQRNREDVERERLQRAKDTGDFYDFTLDSRRFFDLTTGRSTTELRAVVGFLRDVGEVGEVGDASKLRDALKEIAGRVLREPLCETYRADVNAADRPRAYSVRNWVVRLLNQAREKKMFHLVVGDVLKTECIDRMCREKYLDYWEYAENLNLT